MTPASSPSFRTVSMSPRVTYVGPPGSANALTSDALTTLNVYGNFGPGVASARRRPTLSTYPCTDESLSNGSCRSASAADCLPISTSCSAENRLNPDLTCVCANAAPDAVAITRQTAAAVRKNFAVRTMTPPLRAPRTDARRDQTQGRCQTRRGRSLGSCSRTGERLAG